MSDMKALLERLQDVMEAESEGDPDSYRRRAGRCPDGYRVDPKTDRCSKVGLMRRIIHRVGQPKSKVGKAVVKALGFALKPHLPGKLGGWTD